MNVVCYMAITPNGFIAREDDDVSFITKVEWKSFRTKVREAGNLIVGRRTFELMRAAKDLKDLRETRVVVVTRAKNFRFSGGNVFRAKSPKSALALARKQGARTALIAGGGALNGACLKAGLVDELILDVEPALFGKGIKLFGEHEFGARLKLLGVKRLSPNELQLRYRVVK